MKRIAIVFFTLVAGAGLWMLGWLALVVLVAAAAVGVAVLAAVGGGLTLRWLVGRFSGRAKAPAVLAAALALGVAGQAHAGAWWKLPARPHQVAAHVAAPIWQPRPRVTVWPGLQLVAPVWHPRTWWRAGALGGVPIWRASMPGTLPQLAADPDPDYVPVWRPTWSRVDVVTVWHSWIPAGVVYEPCRPHYAATSMEYSPWLP